MNRVLGLALILLLSGCASYQTPPWGGYTVQDGEWLDIYTANGCADGYAFTGDRFVSAKEAEAHRRKLNRQNKARGFTGRGNLS